MEVNVLFMYVPLCRLNQITSNIGQIYFIHVFTVYWNLFSIKTKGKGVNNIGYLLKPFYLI